MNPRFLLAALTNPSSFWFLSKNDEGADDNPPEGDTGVDPVEMVTFSYEIAEDLTDPEFDVDANLETAMAAFAAEYAKGDDADAVVASAIADDVDKLRAEKARRDAETAEKRAALDERAKSLGLDGSAGDDEPGADDEGDKPDSDVGADDEGDKPEANTDDDNADSGDLEPNQALAAAGAAPGKRTHTAPVRTRPRARRAPKSEQLPDNNNQPAESFHGWTMVASAADYADLGATGNEDRVDGRVTTLADAAAGAVKSASGLSRRTGFATQAQFQLSVPDDHDFTNNPEALRDHADDISSYPIAPKASDFDDSGALMASAACGIIEHDYSLYNDSRTGKLLNLNVRVFPRGALEQWQPTTSLCDIIDQLADNVSCDTDTVKTEVELSCPEPMEVCETCARYLIIKHDNFRSRSDQGEIEIEFRKHLDAHMVNKHLDHMGVILNDPTTTPVDMTGGAYPGSIEKDLWVQISLQAQNIRKEHCLPNDYAIHSILPCWAENAIRDATAREHGCHADDVTDAMIRRCFARHAGSTVEFIDWWQCLDPDATQYPNSFDILMMPSGIWFEGSQGVLNLGNEIRDSVNNAFNCFTSFTEDFYTTCRRKYGARLVRVSNCVTGSSPERTVIPKSDVPGVDSTIRPTFSRTPTRRLAGVS